MSRSLKKNTWLCSPREPKAGETRFARGTSKLVSNFDIFPNLQFQFIWIHTERSISTIFS